MGLTHAHPVRPGGHAAAPPRSSALVIAAPHDPAEREADRAAAEVMRGGTVRIGASGGAALARACAACESEAGEPADLHRRAGEGATAGATAPKVVDTVLRAPGRPLEPATRTFFETRFGHDFRSVRVHSDGQGAESARAVNALAYTVGSHVVFDRNRYRPDEPAGQRLLAHELAHVVQQSAPGPRRLVQRQMPGAVPMEPWVRPLPMPRIGPLPRVGPVPEIGPLPPIVIPTPGDTEPEVEIEETPEQEATEEPETADEAEPAQEPEPPPETQPPAEAKPSTEPKPAPWPAPPVGPAPAPEEKEDQNYCGSRRLPFTRVTWNTGPLGQGREVRASPLTRCPPPGIIPSRASASTYPDQFRCIKAAGLSRTWLPLHLLHGPTPRKRARVQNLHGPGDKRWNIIIGDTKMNGDMAKSVEDFVLNRVYDWNQVLWLHTNVDEYFPGLEFFAKRVTMSWGLYNTTTNSEVTTIGGGTFENKAENVPPPNCPPTSPAGAPPVSSAAPGFDSTIGICRRALKSKAPFPVQDGGVELRLRTKAQGEGCDITDFTVGLWKSNKYWVDGDFGSRTIPAGKTVTVRWRNLLPGDYYFVFEVGAHDPKCCLTGDMSVRTFAAARARAGMMA